MNASETGATSLDIVVTANFTAEPVDDALRFWFEQLQMPVKVRHAPFDQVFQQLLDPGSMLRGNQDGIGLVLVRLERWLERDAQSGAARASGPDALARELIDGVREALDGAAFQLVVCFCPATGSAGEQLERLHRIERTVADALREERGVRVLTSRSLLAQYPCEVIADRHAQRLASIPYTPEYFSVLGTALARGVYGLTFPAHKVLVLDCDDTLWGGLCGELGPLGVTLTEEHLALQRFAAEQRRDGKLICLASRNNEADVFAVFDRNPAMVLTRDDLAAWQINWGLKSDSVAELAARLGLGLDSFLFLDDDPVQCAEVRRRFPEVLAIPVPRRGVAGFCRHIWPLDPRSSTAEGSRRTRSYREHAAREDLRASSQSFQQFLDSLELEVDIAPLAETDLARASELTFRTNQFNLTGRRVSEAEFRQRILHHREPAFGVRVRDRFGDYGLVGLVLAEPDGAILRVPIMLLSCRALGRGVEHRMVAHLGRLAREHGAERVALRCVPSDRNDPAREFLHRIGGVSTTEAGDLVLELEAARAEQVRLDLEAAPCPRETRKPGDAVEVRTDGADAARRTGFLARIPTGLADAAAIHAAVREWARGTGANAADAAGPRDTAAADGAAEGPVEAFIRQTFAELLGMSDVPVDTGFFELGGDSLQAVQVLARVSDEYGVELDPTLIFTTGFTVADLVQALDGANEGVGASRTIEPGTACEGPVSFGQQRMWFLEQFEGDAGVFTIPVALRLEGHLDVPALQRALAVLSRRQTSLRTRFERRGDELLQVIESSGPKLERRSAANWSSCRAEISRLAGRRLDLEAGPPWRALLFEPGRDAEQGEQVLFLHFHHAIIDGLSLPALFDELSAAYADALGRRTAGGEPGHDHGRWDDDGKPEPAPVRYLDYAAWQRRVMEAGGWDDQLAFWKARLAGPLPVLELPTDRPRPARQSFDGGTCRSTLPPALVAQLTARAQSWRGTLFNALLAGFYALLQRYSGQNDLVIGTPVSTRSRPELESVVGLFINTLALRQPLDPDMSLEELFAATRDLCAAAFARQELPFERVVAELEVDRDLSRTPVFQAQIAFRDAIEDRVSLPGLRGVVEPVDRSVAPTDLALWIERRGDALALKFEYPTALFDTETVDRMLAHYQRVLEQLVSTPQRKLREVDWLDPAERHRVLEDWNATDRPVPEGSVLEAIEARAAAAPEAPAVRCGERELGYGELLAEADRLAGRIAAELGPRKAQPVIGLALSRSEQLVVAVLAAWKAGCAYLPLDPGFPRDRLGFMAEDAGAALVVTDADGAAPLDFDGPILAIDPEAPAADAPAPSPVGKGELAYVIYTSGSTGRPKGVRVGVDAVHNFLHSMARTPGLAADDVLLAVTTLSFDISVLELLLPLTVGATVHVAGQDDITDAQALMARIEDSGATVLQATPSTWRMLVEAGWGGKADLRALCGGEALPRDLAEALLPRVASLWNMYGPTETTVWSSCERITGGQERISVGRPIDNTRIYILDEGLQPVPIGVVGELCIGGAGVAEGYHERDVLTRERFVDDPFRDEPGARIYRTGDAARYLADGRIEHLGRIDDQVKVRGFRIELGEIEACLGEQPGIEQAAVKVFEPTPGDQRLVAYLVTAEDKRPSTIKLRKGLRLRLPDYMIPQHFQSIDALPLTPSGKLDRQALPKPEALLGTGQTFEAPATDTEREIGRIWADLIGAERVGREDNFFELGGHSLLAMRASRRMADAFGCRVPPQALVMHSLREIGAEIDARATGADTAVTGEERRGQPVAEAWSSATDP